jgi:hypothetical protein
MAKKKSSIFVNLLMLSIVAVFVIYVAKDMGKSNSSEKLQIFTSQSDHQSPYKIVKELSLGFVPQAMEIDDNYTYFSYDKEVIIFNANDDIIKRFQTSDVIRDMVLKEQYIYLLHEKTIEIYLRSGKQIQTISSCDESSIFSSMALSKDYIYATDAKNKRVLQFSSEGTFVKFIDSPNRFVIPSGYFEIAVHGDSTLWVVNSGRHK